MSEAVMRVLKYGERLETLLTEELGATGSGLGEKLISVEHRLSDRLVREIKQRIVPERNEAAHRPTNYSLLNPEAFYSRCERAVADLTDEIAKIKAPPPPPPPPQGGPAWQPQPSASGSHRSLAATVAMVVIAVVVGVILGRSVFAGHGPSRAAGASRPDDVPAAMAMGDHVGRPRVSARAEREVRRLQDGPAPVTRKVATALAAPAVSAGGRGELQARAVRNALVRFSGLTLWWGRGGFGEKRLVIRATVTNRWTQYLASLTTRADVYVPKDNRWIRGVKQHVYFSSKGLAPGQSTTVQFRLGGTFGDYRLQVPDVVNARRLKVVLRISSASDGIGDQVSPSGRVTSAG